jgi:hypothetical protein
MKLPILLFVSVIGWRATAAQKQILSVGNTTALTIKSGTVFSADSLVLTPGTDLTLSANTVTVSPAAVNIAPNPSINRVYYLGSQISFTGTVQIYYEPAELNGNTESTLKYTDSAVGGSWLQQSASSVNTSLHYVQFAATGHSFIGATASGNPTALALSLISFSGNWDQLTPTLEWVVDQTGADIRFNVQSSTDGATWNTIGEVAGLTYDGAATYSFTDANPAARTMYYRIQLIQASGQGSYSNTILLKKAGNGDAVRLLVGANAVSVFFSANQPTAIRLIGVSGQVLRSDMTSRGEYDFGGLVPGAYFLQYDLNGQWMVRKFVIF